MRALFDVNVLIALVDQDHVHHELTHAWWKANKASGWATCPLTENGFVRVISQPKYPNAVSTPDAIRRLRQSQARGGHEFWRDELTITDGTVFDSALILSHGKITDLYLLALAVLHAGRLVTFDRGVPLPAVVAADPPHLVVL